MSKSTLFKKGFTAIIIVLFVGMSLIPSMVAENPVLIETIYVDDDGGADYTKIQNAINAANPGDTVFVYNGIYNETLKIDKSINLIGEDKEKTVIDGRGVEHVIKVTADDVSISGFTIQHSGSYKHYAGILVGIPIDNPWEPFQSIIYNVTICDNNINNNISTGITFSYVHNSNIYNNNISGGARGIELRYSSNNKILGNLVQHGWYNGIYLQGWMNGRIFDYFYGPMTENNLIIGNTVTNYRDGILLGGSTIRNIVTGNHIFNNRENGIVTAYSFKNDITNNNLIDNVNNGKWYADRLHHLNANNWDGNYWGEPKDGSVPINGFYLIIILIPFGSHVDIPLVTYDRNPAQEPYEI